MLSEVQACTSAQQWAHECAQDAHLPCQRAESSCWIVHGMGIANHSFGSLTHLEKKAWRRLDHRHFPQQIS